MLGFSSAARYLVLFSNFNSIVTAIAEGRRLFTNIRRFILHLLSVNVAEVVVLVIGLCFIDNQGKSTFPLSPIGVLWVNMVCCTTLPDARHCLTSIQLTSGPPAFGLGMEKATPNMMKRPPNPVKIGIFSWPIIIDCFSYGFAMGVTSLMSVRVNTTCDAVNSLYIIVRHCRLWEERRFLGH